MAFCDQARPYGATNTHSEPLHATAAAARQRGCGIMGEVMKQCITLVLAGSVAIGAWLAGTEALAQQKSPLVGAWTFVSSTTKGPDGNPVWGSNPIGLTIFTESGHYSSHVLRADRPKFSAKSRMQGTPEENKAAVQGGIASFGTYTVNEANQTSRYDSKAAAFQIRRGPSRHGSSRSRGRS